jgi:hypothetical protein
MSSKTSSEGGSRSANPPSTQPTSTSTKSKKSTAYSRNFDQHLTDCNIEPLYSSEEPDLNNLPSKLAQPRPSLSPSKFSDDTFKAFRKNNAIAKDEDDVLANVMPTILGPSSAEHPSARNTAFGNLEPLTDGTIAPAKPDIYYGSLPEHLSQSVRDDIGQHIIPSTMRDKPLAPNFFVEVKGPDGSAAVATRQARYDGAVGSRAMHSLQNYGRQQPEYDGQAYVFSSTYHDGTLKIYAHHPTAPKTDGMSSRYHMTQIKAYAITNDRETFVQGSTAFRNARDIAMQYRDDFIQTANSRASQHAQVALAAAQLEPEEESADEFLDCLDSSPPRTPGEVGTDTNDHSQGSTLPEIGDSIPSLATSFKSDFTADRPKRSRQLLSPDSKATTRSPPSKSRHPRGAGRMDLHTGEAEPLWVETYFHEGHICFRVDEEEIKTGRKEWALQTLQDGRFCFRWHGSKGQTVWTKNLAAP